MDAQVAAVAGRIGPAQLDRLVAETIKRFELAVADPAADPEDGYLHVDPRHATLHDEDVHFAGTMRFEAELDIADAMDLDRSLAQKAAEQKALGSTESLDVRRSKALGDLARTETALDLLFSTDGRVAGEETTPRWSRAGEERAGVSRPDLPAAREVVLHAHFDASTVGETTVFGPTGRLEERQRLVLLDQLKTWCGDTRTKITIKPVIDLNAQLTAPGYDIPDRIREQVILRDRTCVFPQCTRPARGCDIDHVIPYDHTPQPKTDHSPDRRTDNLAALCRHHHRLKTHTAWRYRMTANGVFEWTSPHGHRFRRDPTGTTAIDPADGPPARHPTTPPTMTPPRTPPQHDLAGALVCRHRIVAAHLPAASRLPGPQPLHSSARSA